MADTHPGSGDHTDATRRCPWCEHQHGRIVPVAFNAAVVDEHGRARENGACRRHTAALIAWFTGESRTGTVAVRRAVS